MADYDVILKSATAQPYLALRRNLPNFEAAVGLVRDIAQRIGGRLADSVKGDLTVVAHSDFDEEDLDLEIGYVVKDQTVEPPRVPGLDLTMRELPPAPSLATLVRRGARYQAHIGYGALGLWMSANQYQINGPSREVLLELPFQRPGQEEMVMEIQFPVTKAA